LDNAANDRAGFGRADDGVAKIRLRHFACRASFLNLGFTSAQPEFANFQRRARQPSAIFV
jgi:hypothetical protein